LGVGIAFRLVDDGQLPSHGRQHVVQREMRIEVFHSDVSAISRADPLLAAMRRNALNALLIRNWSLP
jgi:hypothetical protein